MRLQEILERTGLTRKAVYFYISEGLIKPERSEENGYFEFSTKDLHTLQTVKLLRDTGMSMEHIKDAIVHPTQANFFLHRQVHEIKESIEQEMQQLKLLNSLFEEIPPNATTPSLIKYRKEESSAEFNPLIFLHSDDANMVSIIMYAGFLDIPVNEYRRFLWHKICAVIATDFDERYQTLTRLIYRLDSTMIRHVSTFQYETIRKITEAEPFDAERLAEESLKRIEAFCSNQALQQMWIIEYEAVLKPSKQFYRAGAAPLLKEYNPAFGCFLDRIAETIPYIKEMLKKRSDLTKILIQKMGPYMDLENESDLFFLLNFEVSIYTCLSIEELKQICQA
ncbi:MAG: MerR family transcriptional regulator [Solobacterium sp.]|jgi:DNA-binding transcriptional MerR regulator|nr:MerR family transcriptional regulator [Solobacterium sp.]